MHAKRVCKDSEIKKFGEYYDLCLNNNTLLLADAFGNFREMCLKTYHLYLAKFFSAPKLVWEAALKRLIFIN